MTGPAVTPSSASAHMAPLVRTIWSQSIELHDAVSGRLLSVPSAAPGWTRENVLRHLVHCAEVTSRLTESALAGRDDVWYPGGPDERAASLASSETTIASRLVDDGIRSTDRLRDLWDSIDPEQFARSLDEPELGRISINDLVSLRAIEILMHGLDLNVGLRAERWPLALVTALVPWRVAWLARRPRPSGVETNVRFWVEATDFGRVWLVVGTGADALVEAHDAVGDDGVPTMRLTNRELLHVLVGRIPPHVTAEPVAEFVAAFPGP